MDTSRFPPSLLREYENLTEALPSLFLRGVVIGFVLMTTFWIAIRIVGTKRLPPSLQLKGFWLNFGYIVGGIMYFSIVSSALTFYEKANWNAVVMVIAFMPFWHVIMIRSLLLWKFFGRLRLAPPKDDDEVDSLVRKTKPKGNSDKTKSIPKINTTEPSIELSARINKNRRRKKTPKKTNRNRRSK